jgi:hypothetical protein
MPRRIVLLLLVLALAGLAGACAKAKKNMLVPNVAPETFLFVHPDSTLAREPRDPSPLVGIRSRRRRRRVRHPVHPRRRHEHAVDARSR